MADSKCHVLLSNLIVFEGKQAAPLSDYFCSVSFKKEIKKQKNVGVTPSLLENWDFKSKIWGE